MQPITTAIPYFSESELQCKGTGIIKLDPRFADALPKLREAWGKPLTPNSVCRNPEHNKAVGGLGSGLVKFHRAGDLHPDLQFTINAANRLGGKVINRTPNVSLGINTFDGTINSQAEVVITTDASWDQINSDVHVQVVFFG